MSFAVPVAPLAPFLGASLDLGSNNFRLLIAELHHSRVVPIYEKKVSLRIGAQLDSCGNILATCYSKMLDCILHFKASLEQYKVEKKFVSVVATHVFREAPNALDIIRKLEAVLHYPIKVLTGEQEAQLVFKGVIQSLPKSNEKRLVIDIGGGSTECVIGKGLVPDYLCSMKMGCVSWTHRYFDLVHLTTQAFKLAEKKAFEQLQPYRQRLMNQSWDKVYASSGTLRIVLEVLADCSMNHEYVSLVELNRLHALLLEHRSLFNFTKLCRHSVDELSVLPGGVILLITLMKTLGIEEISPSQGALQLGVLYDLGLFN
jgi:exopolyphosphatase / guanosine-5'-triphosphate,3'-diphosphate pyrophosphatase